MSIPIGEAYSTGTNATTKACCDLSIVTFSPTGHWLIGIVSSVSGGTVYGVKGDGNLNPTNVYSGETPQSGDAWSFAYRQDLGYLYIRRNGGAWLGGGDPVAGTSPTLSGLSGPQFVTFVEQDATLNSVTGWFNLDNIVEPIPSGFTSWSGV